MNVGPALHLLDSMLDSGVGWKNQYILWSENVVAQDEPLDELLNCQAEG